MKSIIISIRPEWTAKILNGEKTIEVRKTAPKDLPCEVYIYCTQGEEELYEAFMPMGEKAPYQSKPKWCGLVGGVLKQGNHLNGKVVAKFTLREVTQYINGNNVSKDSGYMFGDAERGGVYEKACLTDEDIDRYIPDESFYAWRISDLQIFDEPKDLSEFGLKRAPQSWQYVEERE